MGERLWGYVLRGGDSTLENYVFKDWKHAESWIGPGKGRIYAATYKLRECCEEPYAFKLGELMLDGGERIIRDMSTPESREFWESAERSAAEVETWPDWKRAGINVAQQRKEPRR